MLIVDPCTRERFEVMDPNCALCDAPPHVRCPCENDSLQIAVQQAEQRTMSSIMDEIRIWVTQHAKNYILQYYTNLVSHRNAQHQMHIQYLHNSAAMYHMRGVDPYVLEQAEMELKRGIDEDWRQSVRRYPEVLDYFYGLVDLNLPSDSSPQVQEPPLDGGLGRRRGGGILAHKSTEVEVREPPPLERRRSRRGRRLSTRTPPPLAPSAPPPPIPRAPPPPMMPGVQHTPAPGYGYSQHVW